MINISDLIDQSVEVIKWEGIQSILLVALLTVCTVINIVGKGLFIHFIWKWAPKGRPINIMFMKDQVRFFKLYQIENEEFQRLKVEMIEMIQL